MNFRQLQYFVAVAEELHFGRAAERLSMSQPPLSQQILALERELGIQLFTRTKRAVALTHAAKQWLPEVQAVLAAAKSLPLKLKGLWRGEAGSLSISFVTTADYSVLPILLRQYTAQFPNVRIKLQEATSDVQIDALLRDEIDLGIIIPPHAGKLPPSLSYLKLQREPLVAAIPDDWIRVGRIKGAKGIPLKAIADAPLILFPRESAPTLHDVITSYYAANGCSPHFGQQAIQMQTIVSLVSAGMGVALVPESLRNLQRAGVAYRDLNGPKPFIETGLAWRKQHSPSALTAFLKTATAIL